MLGAFAYTLSHDKRRQLWIPSELQLGHPVLQM